MILQERQKVNTNVGVLPSQNFDIDLSPEILKKIITTFVKDYKDPKGSIVRESISNNYDAMVSLKEAEMLAEEYNLTKQEGILLYDNYHIYNILKKRFQIQSSYLEVEEQIDEDDYTILSDAYNDLIAVDSFENIEEFLQNLIIKDLKDPVTIKLTDKSISFIDYGIGLSPARVKYVFGFMFTSTKMSSSNAIGAFG